MKNDWISSGLGKSQHCQFFLSTLAVGAETVPPLLTTDLSNGEGNHFAPGHRALGEGGGTCPWACLTLGARPVPRGVLEMVSVRGVWRAREVSEGFLEDHVLRMGGS